MIPCQRHLFDIPPDVAYLNCAYISPLMHAVREVGEASTRRKCRPWEIVSDDFFTDAEEGRRLFADLVGASTEDIALVPAASYGVSTAARNVPLSPGREVLLLEEQFPSNVYPWRERARECAAEVRTLPRPEDDDWTRCILEALDERVAVAALPHAHWTDGALIDLERVGARCREVGAMLVVDGTQSVGALPFDVTAIQPDFLVVATYKWLLGPYSAGYLYVAPERHDGMPIEHNWADRARSEDFTGLVDYRDAFAPGARRYDVGERGNFHLLPMANAALRQVHEWGVESIQETIRARTRPHRGAGERARNPDAPRRPARRALPGTALSGRRPRGAHRAARGGAGLRERARAGRAASDPAPVGQRRGRSALPRGAGGGDVRDPLGINEAEPVEETGVGARGGNRTRRIGTPPPSGVQGSPPAVCNLRSTVHTCASRLRRMCSSALRIGTNSPPNSQPLRKTRS